MKINVVLKDEQKEFLDQVLNDYSLKNIETSIQFLVSEILSNYDHERSNTCNHHNRGEA